MIYYVCLFFSFFLFSGQGNGTGSMELGIGGLGGRSGDRKVVAWGYRVGILSKEMMLFIRPLSFSPRSLSMESGLYNIRRVVTRNISASTD